MRILFIRVEYREVLIFYIFFFSKWLSYVVVIVCYLSKWLRNKDVFVKVLDMGWLDS